MEMIFKGQTALNITVTVGVDITGAVCAVKYRKPDGTTGSLPATISNAESGIIVATPENSGVLDQAGRWAFWGYITFSDGGEAAGIPEELIIYEEGRLPRSSSIYN